MNLCYISNFFEFILYLHLFEFISYFKPLLNSHHFWKSLLCSYHIENLFRIHNILKTFFEFIPYFKLLLNSWYIKSLLFWIYTILKISFEFILHLNIIANWPLAQIKHWPNPCNRLVKLVQSTGLVNQDPEALKYAQI